MPNKMLLLAFFLLILSAVSDGLEDVFNMELIAEFVTIDYLWDSTHSRSLYQESGQFVVANNALAGIKVSSNGDIYVSVPRWMSGVPSSLNQLVVNPNGHGYVLAPWPSWEFNDPVNGTLKYTQSFVIDSQNCMWIAEVGRTNFYDANPSLITSGKAGILIVNITEGTLKSSYYFPESVVSYNSSFVNDIVLDEINGYAYLTNTWGNGAIIVFDYNNNVSHSFSGLSTQRNSSYDFCVNQICYGTDGVGASPSDGIALSDDGKVLYWSAVQGQALFSINTSFLQNFSLTDEEFQQKVSFLGFKTGCSDGLLFFNGNLFYGDLQHSALSVINNIGSHQPQNGLIPSTVSQPSAYSLNWIDTFAPGLNGENSLYFTTNRLNLFFSSSMDFTGQSGANFRVFRASYSSPVSPSESENVTLSPGQVAGIVIGSLMFAILSIAYHEYFHGRKR